MRNTIITYLTTAACLACLMWSCSGGDDHGASHEAHSEDDGHNHGTDESDPHTAGEDEHEHGGETHELGSVTAAGTTLSVTTGNVEAGAEIDVELNLTSGDVPSAIRVWVGLESGVDSLKVKADRHDEHFHAHVDIPKELSSEARLWVQVESASGGTETQSLALPSETHGE